VGRHAFRVCHNMLFMCVKTSCLCVSRHLVGVCQGMLFVCVATRKNKHIFSSNNDVSFPREPQ